jgi:hypothetical protein
VTGDERAVDFGLWAASVWFAALSGSLPVRIVDVQRDLQNETPDEGTDDAHLSASRFMSVSCPIATRL